MKEFPDWPVYEGHHDEGLFNRSAAVNRAAAIADKWDVAVIIDSDVLADPPAVRRAVRQAHDTKRFTMPFTHRHNLSEEGTKRILEGYRGNWERYIRRTFPDDSRHERPQVSSVIVIPRRLWNQVGGFDEGFRGWGQEDSAFAIACEVAAGPIDRLPGVVWHLHHASAVNKRNTWNPARLLLYQAPGIDLARIKDLYAEGRAMSGAQKSDIRDIPRIIHRTVPAETGPTVERFWQRWQSLHPGWRFMDHRDPLDPAAWPMTGHLWEKAKAPAQKADLIRLEALIRWGGFYVDSDIEPFRSLEPLVSSGLVAAWEDHRCIPNAFLGATPSHDAIHEVLRLCLERLERGTIWDAGPGATTDILKAHPEALVLPPAAMYGVHYRDPDRDRAMREFSASPPPWAFGLHLYAGSWLEPARRRPLDR